MVITHPLNLPEIPMSEKLSRLSRLGALTTRVSGSYLGQAITGLFQDEEARKKGMERTHLSNAERIVRDLGAMKGAAMKVGQAVAQLSDSLDLPPDVRLVLGRLHDKVEAVPFAQVRARVEAELGGTLEDLFASFDPEPLGTASLGQAHAATLKGEGGKPGSSVVVKVLHTGIDGSVHADLSALKTMLVAGRILRRPKEEIDAIFDEIEERLVEELDYRQEARNLQEFRRWFQDTPDIHIPFVHEGWSTGRVLTMERLPGRPLAVFAATAPEPARQRASLALARAFLQMQYRHRAIHADPHPGNYLFTPDGRVGILDFGCVRRFDLAWMASYGGCGYATRHDDRESCMQNALAFNALSRRDPGSEDALWDLCRAIGRPFRGGPFLMGGPEDSVNEQVAAVIPRVMVAPALCSPRELVFLHRSLGGMHQILRQLRARHDWGALFEEAYLKCRADAEAQEQITRKLASEQA